MKKLLISISIIFLVSSFVFSEDEDELWSAQQEKINTDRQIVSVINSKQKEIKKQETLKDDIEFLEAAEGRESKEYQEALSEYKEIKARIDEVNHAAEVAELELEKDLEVLAMRLRALYANSDSFVLGAIMESGNLMEFFEKVEFMTLLAENDKRLIERLKMNALDLYYKRDLLLEQDADMTESINEMNERISRLEAEQKDVATMITQSEEQVRIYDRRVNELHALSRELVDEIRELQKNSKYAGGNMLWPVPSYRKLGNRLFGNQLHPILKKWRMHNGVDISGKNGASIIAANAGTVIYSGWRGGYGYCVIIDHGGGIATLYAHCSKLLVSKGKGVVKGETIAKIGSTGLSTGPHLHFEVRVDGKPIDPLLHVGPKD